MIVLSRPNDFDEIHEIINDAAIDYKGVIPIESWKEPYMTSKELNIEMEEGVRFWCYREGENILGIMGIQPKGDVTLIRHAYTRTIARGRGIGAQLINHLTQMTDNPILTATWSAADWAIDFYQRNGFQLVPEGQKDGLLQTYWNIPDIQSESSVVLASGDWENKG